MRETVVRTIIPGIITLLLTATAAGLFTRFVLEHVALNDLVLTALFRNRDPFPGIPLPQAVAIAIGRSLVLIVGATAVAAVLGIGLAIMQFTARSRSIRALAWGLGTIGVSLPSFFWAMLLQLAIISWYLSTKQLLLPTSGYGLDEHIVLPMLALAARPTAYVFRTTATALQEIAGQDYVRTGHAKGLSPRLVLRGHVIPNARPTALAGVSYASRSVLSSLAIVEYLFTWNGAGLAFIVAIATGNVALATGMAVALSVLFGLVNVLLAVLARSAPVEALAAA